MRQYLYLIHSKCMPGDKKWSCTETILSLLIRFPSAWLTGSKWWQETEWSDRWGASGPIWVMNRRLAMAFALTSVCLGLDVPSWGLREARLNWKWFKSPSYPCSQESRTACTLLKHGWYLGILWVSKPRGPKNLRERVWRKSRRPVLSVPFWGDRCEFLLLQLKGKVASGAKS